MTVYAYIRVSTDLQNCANQHFEIENYATKNKIHIEEWVEETISSRKPLNKRKFGQLLKNINKNDIIIATEISRLGRNMLEIMGILQHCLERNCQIITLKENYHLGADIQSKVLAFAFSLASEIERQLISQRTLETLHRLKKEGKHLGRPFGGGYRKLRRKHNKIVELLNQHISKRQIAQILNCSESTLNRYIAENITNSP
ncbi:MAG: recombinase family protein [Alphaproteobacteria bacterium]|nr:recombinase family protein [Alphaproteobacteria bacterium]